MLENNIFDTALIFEGGGMRGSYSAGLLNILLEERLHFDYVAGISAGSSLAINYLSRDRLRARRSFVEFALDPEVGGVRSFLKGEGYFRSDYIYGETYMPDAILPFDYETFDANPARLRIGAFEMESGELRYFGRDDISDVHDLMRIVRASSSLPVWMPPTALDGGLYVDGGLGGGIALDIAKREGFRRFFVVLSRPRGYRKSPYRFRRAIKAYFRQYPHVAEAIFNRHTVYNRTLDELEALERAGSAYLVYPDSMPVSNGELNYKKLATAFGLGYWQGRRDAPAWREFLGLSDRNVARAD